MFLIDSHNHNENNSNNKEYSVRCTLIEFLQVACLSLLHSLVSIHVYYSGGSATDALIFEKNVCYFSHSLDLCHALLAVSLIHC